MPEKNVDKKANQDDGIKLESWKQKIRADEEEWETQVSKMEERAAVFDGSHELTACCDGDQSKETYHDTQLTYELIEAQIDTNIPSPKVTPLRQQDEEKAKIIEDMLRNKLDQLPFERMNDASERLCPLQGGNFWSVEWDNSKRTHYTVGELEVQILHPKQVVPQRGIYTGIEDMNHITIRIAQTREELERRYQVDLSQEQEEKPEVRGAAGESVADGLLTQYIVYYRNENGGIGRFSWVNDVVLEDYENYQARRLRRCTSCGAVEPVDSEPLSIPSPDGKHPKGEGQKAFGEEFDGNAGERRVHDPKQGGKKQCPYCGGTSFEEAEEGFEEITTPKVSAGGVEIPGVQHKETIGEDGTPQTVAAPTQIPFYKPDIFPIILQRNVSVFGQLLGDSDADKIRDQHNTRNRLSKKILDKLLKAGSFATLPSDATIRTDNEDMKYVRLENPADKQMIDVFNMEGEIGQDLTMYQQIYEEARNIIGITDSFQGRKDSTATSGKAKEFSAAQSAGRLESKRTMKDAAYAELFEAMFKFALAYADEPRSVLGRNIHGDTEYETFDRYDFLEQDESGQYFWNDMFLFACDTSAPLASDREAMWQETRLNLQQGAFGDPASYDTLILFWRKMADLHYPGALETKQFIEEKLQQRQAMMMQQQQMQQEQAMMNMQLQEDQVAADRAAQILTQQKGEKNGDTKDGKTQDSKQLRNEADGR